MTDIKIDKKATDYLKEKLGGSNVRAVTELTGNEPLLPGIEINDVVYRVFWENKIDEGSHIDVDALKQLVIAKFGSLNLDLSSDNNTYANLEVYAHTSNSQFAIIEFKDNQDNSDVLPGSMLDAIFEIPEASVRDESAITFDQLIQNVDVVSMITNTALPGDLKESEFVGYSIQYAGNNKTTGPFNNDYDLTFAELKAIFVKDND